MRRVRRFAAIAGICLVALLIAVALILGLSWPRSALTSVALRFFLQQRNLHVAHGSIHVGHGVLDFADLQIKDGSGNDFFLAKHITILFEPSGLIGRSDRRLGLQSIVLERPVLRLIHLADGSWNVSALTAGNPGPSAVAQPQLTTPYRLKVRVEAGEVAVIDPQALVRFAHAFSLNNISGTLALNERGVSSGVLRANLRSAQGATAVQADFLEDDTIAFARAKVAAHGVAIAPLVDAIAPSPYFAIERGSLDIAGQAYAVGYPPGAPRWHLSADAILRGGRMRVIPLVVPLRELHGPLHFQDGLLSTTRLRGFAAGAPLTARGALQLLGGVRFALTAEQTGRLESQRRLFAFSQTLPFAGPASLQVRVDGPVDDLRVSGAMRAHGSRYGPVLINSLRSSFFYNNSHLTMVASDDTIEGGLLVGQGDVDLRPHTPLITLVAQLRLPSASVPFIANLNPAGTIRGLATVTGPISTLSSRGYAQLTGGSARARSFFTVDPNESLFGPLLVQPRSGEVTLASRLERVQKGQARYTLTAFARKAALRVRAGTFASPDLPTMPITLPSLDGVFDGAVVVRPDDPKPSIALNATADRLTVAGVELQHVSIRGAGRNGYIRIGQIAAQGGSTQADAQGAAVVDAGMRLRAAALRGSAVADLASFGASAPSLRMSGSMRGGFYAMLDGAAWTLSAQARSADAKIAGIPVQSADASVSARSASSNSVLANIGLAGGEISAIGTLANAQPLSSASATHIDALADHVDLAALQNFGLPLRSGSAVAVASIGGSLQRPDVHAAAALTTSYRGMALNGDVDVSYRDGTLRSNASRIAVDNNRANLDGSIGRLGGGLPLSSAALDLRLRMREADLAAVNRYTGGRLPLSGATDADVAIGGSPAQPSVNGYIDTDAGTIRGVGFDELHGSIAMHDGYLRLDRGEVQLGQSFFYVSGLKAPSRFALHADSTHVNMSDFNDFFGGADMFAGTGSFRVNLRSSNAGLQAAGGLRLDDAALRNYAIGHIETHFSSANGALLATLLQDGPGGAATVAGRVGFSAYSNGIPNFQSATYNVKANIRNLDVDEITPLFHQEDLGLTGTLDAAGTLQGTLRHPVASAYVSLHDGHLQRIAINSFSALVQSDTHGAAVRNLQVVTKFVTGSGDAHYEFGTHRIAGAMTLNAADLSELSSAFRLPVTMGGKAQAQLTLAGTTTKPNFQASLAGSQDTVAGLVFSDIKARFKYSPGELDIGDSQVGLASGGQVSVTGALPIQLQPLALGPKQRAVGLSVVVRDANLAELNTLTKRAATLNGILNAQIALSGTAGNPSMSGVAQIRKAEIVSPWETVPLTNASADLSLQHDTVTLSDLHGQLGSGSVDIKGAAHIVPAVGLRNHAGLQFFTNVALQNASINVPGWLSGTFNGNLSLTRAAVRPYLAGALTLNNATVPFSAILALASGSTGALAAQTATPKNVPGVPSPAPGHTIVYGGSIFGKTNGVLSGSPQAQATPASFTIPPVDFNIKVVAGNNVRVRGGNAIDLTAAGSVVLAGSLSNPTLSGGFQAVRGQIGYFDTTFRLIRGSVTFSPTEGLLPTLDASAVTTVGGNEITLSLSGRVDSLTIDLQSNPPMSRDQIIATLLHAPQLASLTTGSQQQAQSAIIQTAQSYFTAELTRSLLFPFESSLAQSLNLEQISLIFDPQGNLAIEVRSRFSQNVSALYRSSITVPVTQSYGVSYRLRDYLALELLQSQPPSGQTYTLINLRYLFQ